VSKDRIKPGSGSRESPDVVIRHDDGSRVELRIKREGARKPERYHVMVPSRDRPGWVVYITYVPIMLLVGLVIYAILEVLG
jgi:hypothetical protein